MPSRFHLSRRDVLTGLASAAICWTGRTEAASAEPLRNGALAPGCKGPIFTATGPDAELYGATGGYPVPNAELARRDGNPWEPKYRVGAFSHIDEIYPTRQIDRAATPWTFKCSPGDVSYQFRGSRFSFSDYMSRKPSLACSCARTIRSFSKVINTAGPTKTGSSRSRWSNRLWAF